jgi:hypothetical protein
MGLGATAPEGDFDYRVIGGSPWAIGDGCSSSSCSDHFDASSYYSESESDDDSHALRPETAPAVAGVYAHAQSARGSFARRPRPDPRPDTAAVVESGSAAPSAAAPVVAGGIGGGGGHGAQRELQREAFQLEGARDPAKSRDPATSLPAWQHPGEAPASSGLAASATLVRPRSAHAASRPRSAAALRSRLGAISAEASD